MKDRKGVGEGTKKLKGKEDGTSQSIFGGILGNQCKVV